MLYLLRTCYAKTVLAMHDSFQLFEIIIRGSVAYNDCN